MVSKPPHEAVLRKISEFIKTLNKPVVAIFIGADKDLIERSGAIAAGNLEEAALLSVALANNTPIEDVKTHIVKRAIEIKKLAAELSLETTGKYLRGLFSGGTLCDETQLVIKNAMGYAFSNTPLCPENLLPNIWISKEHTILDLGDDVFTAGRPHPMIDFSLRNKRIVEEAKDKEVAIILLDVVLGYGSNLQPDLELIPAITQAKAISPKLQFVCSITGTDQDPQNFSKVKNALEQIGVKIMPSNYAASELCVEIISFLNK